MQFSAKLIQFVYKQTTSSPDDETNISTYSTQTLEDPADAYEEQLQQTIAYIAYTYVLSAIIAVGVTGNFLNLIVLSRRNMQCVTYTYLRALALSDITALLLVITYAADLYALKPKSTLAEAIYGAHIEFPLKQTFNATSTLIVIAVTIERFLALCYPHRARAWCTRHRTPVVALLLLIYALLWNIPRIFERHIIEVQDSSTNETLYYDKNLSAFGQSLYYRVHTIIYAAMFQFLPLLTLASLNICILVAMKKFHRNRIVLLNKREAREQGEQKRMTVMLLGIIIMFLVLVIPSAVAYIIQADESFATKVFIIISDVMGEANFAMNFFVYCLCNRDFRKTFKKVFCGCPNNKVTDDSNTKLSSDRSNNPNSTSKNGGDTQSTNAKTKNDSDTLAVIATSNLMSTGKTGPCMLVHESDMQETARETKNATGKETSNDKGNQVTGTNESDQKPTSAKTGLCSKSNSKL